MYKNILLFYKRSAYEIYFLSNNRSLAFFKNKNTSFQMKKFIKAHQEHYASLEKIETILKKNGANYNKYIRGSKHIHFEKYDLILSVGGDGTYLEAARNAISQPVIGINSSPNFSIGKLCAVTSLNFKVILKKLLKNSLVIRNTCRLELRSNAIENPIIFVNDILISHMNPAAMSRYRIKIRGQEEDQKSSGLWIATPSGSTGAIHSAGAKCLSRLNNKFLYKPRELYNDYESKYIFKGGVLSGRSSINVLSLMRKGKIYIDGAHFTIPFSMGDQIVIKISRNPLKTII